MGCHDRDEEYTKEEIEKRDKEIEKIEKQVLDKVRKFLRTRSYTTRTLTIKGYNANPYQSGVGLAQAFSVYEDEPTLTVRVPEKLS